MTATAQVAPVLAPNGQTPAWAVIVNGDIVATFPSRDDAHQYRRQLNTQETT